MTNTLAAILTDENRPEESPHSIGLLLVEDSISDAKLFENVLSRAKDADRYSVVHVKRLAKALKLLNKTEFQAIVLDLQLPDSQGLESVESLVREYPHIPIIVMTGMDGTVVSIEALRRGAQDYIVKGNVDGDLLSECIRYAVERHRIVSNLAIEKDRHKFYADHDHLTELPNRKFFYYHLEHALAQAQRNSRSLAVLFLDLDDFKSINDNYGHRIGDTLLKNLAERLRGVLRSSDIAARIGGDEFVIVLHDLKRDQDAGIAAERITEALSQSYAIEDFKIKPEVSIGISIFPKDEKETSALISAADFAMLQAKQMGKNQYCYFSQSMNVKAQETKELELQLSKAMENGDFENHYQPEFDIITGRITAVQALVRWKHPELGLVPARFFISVLEQNGFIHKLNDWILVESSKQLKLWHNAGYEDLCLSLNLASASIYRSEEFLNLVAKTLKETKLNPATLRFEIRESDILNHGEAAISLIKQLSSLGVQLLLDGFGTGFSSMTHLGKLPIKCIKIDRSVVQKSTHDVEAKGLVNAIVALARASSVLTIGEGVETHEQYQVLQSCGCDRAQGFYLGKPSSAKTADLILRARAQSGE